MLLYLYLFTMFYCAGSNVNAYYDQNFNTIRHTNGDWIIGNNSESTRCDSLVSTFGTTTSLVNCEHFAIVQKLMMFHHAKQAAMSIIGT